MNSDDQADGGVAPWMRAWFDMASGAMEACQAWAGATASPDPIRQMRATLLQAWSDYWDKCFRSSMFLDATKQAVAQGTEYRRQFREYLDRVFSDSPFAGRADLEQLLRAVRRSEERLLEQLDDLTARVESLDAALESLAARLNGGSDKRGNDDQTRPARPERRSRRIPNRTGPAGSEEE